MSPNALSKQTNVEILTSDSGLAGRLSLARSPKHSNDEEALKRSALLAVVVDRLRLETHADGAMIALRETKDAPLVCLASIGKAPALGSRLKLPATTIENCVAHGFSLSAHCAVLVGSKPLEFASALLVPLPSGVEDGVVGIFSRTSSFTPRDWRRVQDVARLFPPALPPKHNRRKLWLFALIPLLLLVTWVAVRYQRQVDEENAVETRSNSLSATESAGISGGVAAPVQNPSLVLTQTVAKSHSGWVTGLAFSADSRRLVSAGWDHTVKTLDVPSGAVINPVASTLKQILAVANSRDGRSMAAETADNDVTIWDATNGVQIRRLPAYNTSAPLRDPWVSSIAFSPDGKWLASGLNSQTVRIWDIQDGQVIRDLKGKKRGVVYAAFSPNGRVLATGDDETSIVLWDVVNGRVLHTLRGHEKLILAVAFSPDGRVLASASADKNIKLWDVGSGKLIATLPGHSERVTTLAFNPGGRWLASGSWDGTVKIWDVAAAREFEEISAHSRQIFSLAFDPRGEWLAAGSSDGTVRLWRFLETSGSN